MNLVNLNPFPVLGEALSPENTLSLDFTEANEALSEVDLSDTDSFNAFIFGQIETANKKYGIGGYLEKRGIYRRSEVFATATSNFRNIHLGVDIWAAAGSPVYAPLAGKIHSFQDNVGFGNYGPTLIISHALGEKTLYSLYGHLSNTSLSSFEVGQEVSAGEQICEIGPFPENGDWPPHLHFQLIWDMGNFLGDYPGVAAEKDLDYYHQNCPDPASLIGYF
ncbi:MAG: peptidoglycan DD-metalloendopeptidase family protein [Algoriphagus sp.]|jgi:murein DD-endopeptidase MepM/ murein hydrolase activator NlpD|nr:peptidoglycan DD-metalloendopeptidase family protein [Algoriphagus sp.]